MFESIYEELAGRVKKGKKCIMLTYLNYKDEKNGCHQDKVLIDADDIEKQRFPNQQYIIEGIKLCISSGKLQLVNIDSKMAVLIEPFAPKQRLVVFGGGHIAVPLVDFASRTGFDVTVIDDRPSFANSSRFPLADKVICESFEKTLSLLETNPSDFMVIMTRGHRYDGIILRYLMKKHIAYTGMVASKRRAKLMMEELVAEGFDQDKLKAVQSPVGLDIRAVTPEEIAVSITAQIISCKNRTAFPELDMEVAERVLQPNDVPKALLTIISTKGSVPRKAGAKMMAYMDGRTYGTIGGGCSESEVLLKARDLMKGSGFFIADVDMTGEIAEEEGMVCGGTMKVIVEAF